VPKISNKEGSVPCYFSSTGLINYKYNRMDKQIPAEITIPKSDEVLLAQCRVETFRAGGPGGQHQNKTETAVRIVHLATGISSVARDERSQLRNRHLAISRLREKLEAHNKMPEPRHRTMIPKREKKRRLERKRQRSQTKRLRKKPDTDLE